MSIHHAQQKSAVSCVVLLEHPAEGLVAPCDVSSARAPPFFLLLENGGKRATLRLLSDWWVFGFDQLLLFEREQAYDSS